eukprot:jgi/Mesvir1/25386/Mv25659-RA.1
MVWPGDKREPPQAPTCETDYLGPPLSGLLVDGPRDEWTPRENGRAAAMHLHPPQRCCHGSGQYFTGRRWLRCLSLSLSSGVHVCVPDFTISKASPRRCIGGPLSGSCSTRARGPPRTPATTAAYMPPKLRAESLHASPAEPHACQPRLTIPI